MESRSSEHLPYELQKCFTDVRRNFLENIPCLHPLFCDFRVCNNEEPAGANTLEREVCDHARRHAIRLKWKQEKVIMRMSAW
jgi:hypothetical protein